MRKRLEGNVVCKVWLCSLVIYAFLMNVDMAVGIDVAICTVSYPWAQDIYDAEIAVVTDAIQGVVNLQSFGADDLDALATWVEDHTSGEKNILILTGIFPSTIYAPGNSEPDGSLIEEFLDAGNTIITTAEYPFYTIEGQVEANEDTALKNILDVPQAEMWQGREGWRENPIFVVMTPTADGKRLVPGITEYKINFPIHVEDYDGTPWELEIAISENTDENLRVEGVLLNTETGGRFGAFVEAPWVDPGDVGMAWGTIMSGYLLNYYLPEVAPVHADSKFITTWCSIKEK